MKFTRVILPIIAASTLPALAGTPAKDVIQPATSPFDRGSWELEGGSGFMGAFSTTPAKRTTINYQLNDLRLGWMYDSPRHSGFFRGNNEFLLEAFGADVTKGPGNYIAGGNLLWRYNFIQPDARFIPYIQLGAGACDNDIHQSHPQRIIGEAFEFVLQGDLGIRYLINDRWSTSIEADYRHISNADLASRNEGLNSIGGLLQLTYSFH